MGKKITVYLTDAEMGMMEKICKKDGHQNQSATLKKALLKLFEGCDFVPEHDHHGDQTAVIRTEQLNIENLDAEEVRKAGYQKWLCPKCGRWHVFPDEAAMYDNWTDEKLKAQGLKKWLCRECGRKHIIPYEDIVIEESALERDQRIRREENKKELEAKLAKARADADSFINSSPDLMTKTIRGGMAEQRLKALEQKLKELDKE